ncbi:mobilization protein [Helicobacter pylori]
MGNLASGHFKPTNNIQEQHNDRTLSPSYLIPQEFRGQNEVNRPSTQARGLRDEIIENAINIYENTKKKNAPKFKAKSYQWSLVVNIKTNTTMSDLEKLAEHFESKYGFQCYQIAIHRDEGYMDENNQPHINHHAHMEFITLNKENGKNMMRKAYLSPKKFADMQTEIAQILGMERGTDKRVSGTERIEPRKYAQIKNKECKELEAKEKELNTLKFYRHELEKVQQERNALKKEIATAIDTANIGFTENRTTLQEAVARIKKNSEMLSAIYNFLEHIAPNYVSEITEKYKQVEFFAKTFGVVKKLKELYSKIVEKLFGDENAKKDHQDILNAITELQEHPTKQQLEAKEKELNTLKQERTDLKDKLQEQEKTINKLNQFKNSSNLALDLEKAQDRIETLESNENTLIKALYDKESAIQSKGRTINRLKKELKELEYNYRQNRERMVAENKRLKEQGLEKTYTQKDYEDLKKTHHQEVEELKKQIQELEKTIKKNNEYTYTKRI